MLEATNVAKYHIFSCFFLFCSTVRRTLCILGQHANTMTTANILLHIFNNKSLRSLASSRASIKICLSSRTLYMNIEGVHLIELNQYNLVYWTTYLWFNVSNYSFEIECAMYNVNRVLDYGHYNICSIFYCLTTFNNILLLKCNTMNGTNFHRNSYQQIINENAYFLKFRTHLTHCIILSTQEKLKRMFPTHV